MRIMTQDIIQRMPKLYSQEHVKDPVCILKIFSPDHAWTWYVVEAQLQEDGDWIFFCKVVSPFCPEGELGYVLLSELQSIRGALGLPVERDLYFKDRPLSLCK